MSGSSPLKNALNFWVPALHELGWAIGIASRKITRKYCDQIARINYFVAQRGLQGQQFFAVLSERVAMPVPFDKDMPKGTRKQKGQAMAFKDIMTRTVTFGIAAQLLIATQYATMAEAKMISTETAISGQMAEVNRAVLLDELQRADVQEELARQGLDPVEVEARLAALTDAEIQKTLAQMEDGSAGAGIVGTLGTIFIILLVTDLLCFTRLFNFTRCIR